MKKKIKKNIFDLIYRIGYVSIFPLSFVTIVLVGIYLISRFSTSDFASIFTDPLSGIAQYKTPALVHIWQKMTGRVYNSCIDKNGNSIIDYEEIFRCKISDTYGNITGNWDIDKTNTGWGLDNMIGNVPLNDPNHEISLRQPNMLEVYSALRFAMNPITNVFSGARYNVSVFQ